MLWDLRKNCVSLISMVILVVGVDLNAIAQDLLVEPQSIDFGSVPIGYQGEAEYNRAITITNQSDKATHITFGINPEDNVDLFSIFSPDATIVQNVIRDIYCAVGCYRQDYCEDSRHIEELQELGYLEILPRITDQWRFNLIGLDPIVQIEAISTDQMPGGEGQVILFDIQSGTFSGYGQIEEVVLEPGENRYIVVSFLPIEVTELECDLVIFMDDGQDTLAVPIHSASHVPETLVVSTNILSFGNVGLTERGRMEVTISNPSRLLIDYDFVFSDADEREYGNFDIHNIIMDDLHSAMLDIYDATQRYQNDNGEEARYLDQLKRNGYVFLSEDITRQWTFALIGHNPIREIEAISTSEMPRGSGRMLLYDIQTRFFTGFTPYGGTMLGPGRDQRFIVEYIPNEVGANDATITITTDNETLLRISPTFTDTAIIAMSGNGVLAAPSAEEAVIPTLMSLSSPYPNPFNSTTTIGYSLPTAGNVSLAVYDLSGREVARLVDSEQTAGNHEVVWTADGVASGVYMVKLDAGGVVAREKVVLVK